MEKKVTRKFKSGGLHERHVVATWKLENHLSIRLQTQGNQEKPVSRWPVAVSRWPVVGLQKVKPIQIGLLFLYNKAKQMHQFHKFIFSLNSTCFEQFLCPSSGVYSLYIQQWYMSYKLVDSCRAGPGWNWSSILVLLDICMTYTIAERTVNKLLIMDRRTVRNMQSFTPK